LRRSSRQSAARRCSHTSYRIILYFLLPLSVSEQDGTSQRFVRTFGTMTADLLALGDWLNFHEVTRYRKTLVESRTEGRSIASDIRAGNGQYQTGSGEKSMSSG
jgi:hypothetical protein